MVNGSSPTIVIFGVGRVKNWRDNCDDCAFEILHMMILRIKSLLVAAHFKINDQLSLSTYLEDEPRGVLRIYMVERLVENHNLCDDQQVLKR
ncbi:hypothetical protein H5410_038292 [Solanum commersonii]|uniref:Uncharacterized protein n=1 Tax=Solanum commersonii TaxID=4109 RepID=A0A9J5YCQ5_SOLCO|nr:hypothetical protein H5410_038292 [Solanum commersonii]